MRTQLHFGCALAAISWTQLFDHTANFVEHIRCPHRSLVLGKGLSTRDAHNKASCLASLHWILFSLVSPSEDCCQRPGQKVAETSRPPGRTRLVALENAPFLVTDLIYGALANDDGPDMVRSEQGELWDSYPSSALHTSTRGASALPSTAVARRLNSILFGVSTAWV